MLPELTWPSTVDVHRPNPPLFTRRELLAAGLGVGALAVLPRASATTRQSPARQANSVILLWMDGGPSHLDTFDPKPSAPSEVRGPIGSIRTALPGVHVSELFPRMARLMDRVTLLRGLTHEHLSHDRACHAHLAAMRERSMPVALSPHSFACGHGGPSTLPTPAAVSHLKQESIRNRERYGLHSFGQRCLAARQLVETGSRFVTVVQHGWDTHCDNAEALKGWLGPQLDQGMSALLEDLEERGLLESTLVVWMGEFGRTPWLNPMAGRDHWPKAGCALFAGAGVPRGHVLGGTDRIGAEPIARGYSPEEVTATILAKTRDGEFGPVIPELL